MPLTRPTVAQLNTVVTEISDPITLLNRGSTQANVDVGFVLNRDGGVSPNVAIYWNETADSLVTAYTTSTGGVYANIALTSYANLTTGNVTANGNITTVGGYFVGNGSLLTGISVSPDQIKSFSNNVTVTSDYVNVAINSSNVASFDSAVGLRILSSKIALGLNAATSNQGNIAVAIGIEAGFSLQGVAAVAIGAYAGNSTQGENAVAVGYLAGYTNQDFSAVAIGENAGFENQKQQTVAIGSAAGYQNQGFEAVAVGLDAGRNDQGNNAVAIGSAAGESSQGINAVAIGTLAGQLNQGNNSIIINATGSALQQTTANTFTVAPIRVDSGNTAQALYYNTTTKEVTYGPAAAPDKILSGASNVTVTSNYVNVAVNGSNVASFSSQGFTVSGNLYLLGSPLAAIYGGTGQSSYTAGDLLYATSSTTLAKLPAGSANQILQIHANAVPYWDDIDGGTY